MKLKTRFFRFLILSNSLVALITVSIFLSYNILNTISYEKENLLLINRRFSCLLNHTLTAFTKTLDTIKYSNDIFLLLTDEERLKKFVSLKINRELENIIKNFPIVKSIFILKDGEIIFPQENLKLNLEKTVFLKDNEVFFVHQIPIDEHMTLASLINISQALREFLENEKLKTNIDLIIFKENYISVSADSARIIGKEDLRSLVLSQKIDFGIFDMYIARPKKLIYSSLCKPILTTVVFLIPFIWVLYVLSKYLSNRISTSLVKITQKLASFKDKKFDIIEVDENLEDELKLFVESHNEVSRELDKYVKDTDKIIQQATEEIRAKNELLEKLSITDELTRLKNRRAFNNLFEKDCTLAYREKLYINFAMLDIDNFKKINDTFGHVAGDLCLKKLAETMQSLFTRRIDNLFRIGGEEFVVYFLSKERTDFYSILEELRKRIENTELNYQDKVIKFTISIGGVSEIPQDQNYKNIVLKADENLYIAKNEGKNRVVLKSHERREEYEKD